MMILPSLLAAPQLQLFKAVEDMMELGLNTFHIDMMDYQFTQNFGLTPKICQSILDEFPEAQLDIHLMTQPTHPELIEQLISMGIYDIAIHLNTLSETNLERLKQHPKLNLRIALLPSQTIDQSYCQYKNILVLAVNPGFSYQNIQPEALQNVYRARENGLNVMLDGGVNGSTVELVRQAKPHSVVIGGGLFGANKAQRKLLINQLTDPLS